MKELKEMSTEFPSSDAEEISWRTVEGTGNNFYRMDYEEEPNYDVFTKVRIQPGSMNGIVVTDVVLQSVWGQIEIATERVDTAFRRGNPSNISLNRYRDELNTAMRKLTEMAETRKQQFRAKHSVD